MSQSRSGKVGGSQILLRSGCSGMNRDIRNGRGRLPEKEDVTSMGFMDRRRRDDSTAGRLRAGLKC